MRAHNAIYLYDAMFIAIDAALPNNAQLDKEALSAKLKNKLLARALQEKHNKILCSLVVKGARYRCFFGGHTDKDGHFGDSHRGGYFRDMHRSSPCSLSLAFCGQVRSEHLPHSLGLQTLASKCKYTGPLTT